MTNSKTTKRALFMSVISLLVCFTMLMGATFAWFTDTVVSSNNKIIAGTLKIDLELLDKDSGVWNSLKNDSAPIFDYELWEPGYTDVKILKIENEGTLALKWYAKFVSSYELSVLANVIDVYVCPSATELTYPDDRSLNGYTCVGTVAEFVNTIEETTTGNLNATESAYLGIALKMRESADNDYQNLGLGTFDIQILATQDTVEADSFDNQYDADAENTAAPTVVATVDELSTAIKNAKKGDVISVEPGVYEITDTPATYLMRAGAVSPDEYDSKNPPFVITEDNVTIEAENPEDKPEFKFITSDTGKITHGFDIRANNVRLENLVLKAGPDGDCSGNLVQISANGNDYYSDITIEGCEFIGSDHSIAMYGNDVTIKDCIFDESEAPEQGNIIYVWGTSGKLTIQGNTFIGSNQRKHGISFYNQSAASRVSGEILIENNTFENVYKGIVHEPTGMKYEEDVTVSILGNTFTNCKKKPVAIDEGTYTSYTVNGNKFGKISEGETCLLDNQAEATVNADENYWGSAAPDWKKVIEGENITVHNYYSDFEKKNLVSVTASEG